MGPSPYDPAVKFAELPGELPKTVVPDDVDLVQVADIALKKLNELSPDSLTEEAFFRDLLILTGSIRTFNTRNRVYDVFKELIELKRCSTFQPSGTEPRKVDFGWVDVDMTLVSKMGILKDWAQVLSPLYIVRTKSGVSGW